jgi:hypothetical protein
LRSKNPVGFSVNPHCQREPAPVVAGTLSAGYTGFVEIEIFNQDVWDAPADQTAATVRQRFARLLA